MITQLNGINYFYQVTGDGEPVLALHGFTGDHTTWDRSCLKKKFRIIAPDLIGHGKTDSPDTVARYEMKQAAKDLAALLDHLKIQKVNVLGYSMGGRLALSFAMYYPERVKKLILESSSPGLKTEAERNKRREQDRQLAEKILSNGIHEFVNYWEKLPLFSTQEKLPEEIRSSIRRQRLKNSPKGLANSLKGMGTGKQPSWWNRLHELNIPVLIICGELDQKFCRIAGEMAERLPDCKTVIIPGCGHTVHVEDPAAFDQAVEQFLL